jgi:hypothetical protein
MESIPVERSRSPELLDELNSLSSHFISEWDDKSFTNVLNLIPIIPHIPEGPVRRLSAIADYEGKTRVIAIGDWLSNYVLKPLHLNLMKFLKKYQSDVTFKSNDIKNIVLGN